MTVDEGSDVEAGPAHEHRHATAIADLRDQSPGPVDPSGDAERLVRVGEVDQVVRNRSSGVGIRLCRADVHAAVDLARVGHEDLDRPAPREGKREIYDYLDTGRPVLRPINYPDEAPGRGWLVHHADDGTEVAVINAMGRVFMNQLDSPFTKLDELLDGAAEPLPPIRILDFHCEITSEKNAMGWYLDGRVSGVVGTHTHVPTADARVLPGGTAYISDIGMTGPRDSVIGFSLETVLPRFTRHLPTRFAVADGPVSFNAVVITADPATGRASGIEQVQRLVEV